jgi:hypothetical protein
VGRRWGEAERSREEYRGGGVDEQETVIAIGGVTER